MTIVNFIDCVPTLSWLLGIHSVVDCCWFIPMKRWWWWWYDGWRTPLPHAGVAFTHRHHSMTVVITTHRGLHALPHATAFIPSGCAATLPVCFTPRDAVRTPLRTRNTTRFCLTGTYRAVWIACGSSDPPWFTPWTIRCCGALPAFNVTNHTANTYNATGIPVRFARTAVPPYLVLTFWHSFAVCRALRTRVLFSFLRRLPHFSTAVTWRVCRARARCVAARYHRLPVAFFSGLAHAACVNQ